jgi:hypothetical protein
VIGSSLDFAFAAISSGLRSPLPFADSVVCGFDLRTFPSSVSFWLG